MEEENERDQHPPHAREAPSNFSAVVAPAWASAHGGKLGQLTPPLTKWMKNYKAKTRKKRAVFYVYVIFRQQSRHAGVSSHIY